MSINLVKDYSLDLSLSADYRKAVLSSLHVAFIDNDNRYVFPTDEKEGLKAALDFYQNRILCYPAYPVYDGKTFQNRDSHDPEVLRQVIGLPEEVFARLDLGRPLLEQIHFDSDINDDRKTVYQTYYGSLGFKWYRDDFKLFCLSRGVYFLYDETKPFIAGTANELPVYFDENRFEPYVFRRLYREATSERLSIDFLGKSARKGFVDVMRRLDGIDLGLRTDYFINGHYHAEIADLNLADAFKNQYALLLRQYIASLINVLYDQYSFEVLNKVTQKMSFMSQSRVSGPNRAYVLSSFQADMYSTNRRDWFFCESDRNRIASLIDMVYHEDPADDILCFYSKLGLPYEGYAAVRGMRSITPSKILARLPFRKSLDKTSRFMSAKRFDTFYSYLTGEKEHRYVFLKRRLQDQGFIFDVAQPFSESEDVPVSLSIQAKDRTAELEALVSEKGMSLGETVFLSYHLENSSLLMMGLREKLLKLDEASHEQACRDFLLSLVGISIRKAVDDLLAGYQLSSLADEDMYRFFRYLFFYPFKIVLNQYRQEMLVAKDSSSIIAVDGYQRAGETYEPNMPYPFVSWGELCYSFREDYFSTPYICLSEKNAIANEISFYSRRFDETGDISRKSRLYFMLRNQYVLEHLGIPENVKCRLNPEFGLLDQIPFKDHICHHCLDAEPAYTGTGDSEVLKSFPDWTYIVAEGVRKGFHIIPGFRSDNDAVFLQSLADHTYHGLVEVDEAMLQPCLLPYLRWDKKALTALVTTCFPDQFLTTEMNRAWSNFLSLGDDKIRHMLFDCRDEDFKTIYLNGTVFNLFILIYRFIAIIYPLKVSCGKFGYRDIPISFNDDDNPRLPFPHVLLGRVFNAYQAKPGDGEIYFCSCDREAILGFLRMFSELCEDNHIRKDIETPLIMGLCGLPYEAILKYMDYDLSLGSVEGLVGTMTFRESICRRCTGINHSALSLMFTKAFPYKDSMEAEWAFARNGLAHDGVLLINSTFDQNFRYDASYQFNLSSFFDDKLPSIYLSGKEPKLPIYAFFHMDYETLKGYLSSFSKTQKDKAETCAYASGVILDTFRKNNAVFYEFFFDNSNDKSYREDILARFGEIHRVREEFQDDTINMILLFLNYLLTTLVENYAHKELRVGR